MKRKLKWVPWLALWVSILVQSVSAAAFLVPVGQVVGLEIQDGTVTVAAFDRELGRAAQEAGLQIGDQLLTVNKKVIHCAEDVGTALSGVQEPVSLQIVRKEKIHTITLTPSPTEKGAKLGVYLKDSITGVGTVTWYDPESGRFGALGHGVSTSGGTPASMEEGSIYDARILSVRKGRTGAPGQLVGTLACSEPTGSLEKNLPQGVFGRCARGWQGNPLPVASKNQVHPGKASIRSTIQGQATGEYAVEILKVYPNSGSTGRNLLLQITDPALLSATGGIVQGMSGSPIIQDGKIIGAVTHVLVGDPTRGYGIFIENMLEAAL